MIEEFLRSLADIDDNDQRKFYGLMVGTVINVVDPLMLGRVQVKLDSIDSLDLSPWARIAQPFAGFLHGTYFVPNLLDEVVVAFEHGDLNAPYVLGSLWSTFRPPPLVSPLPQIRAIRTLVGNQVVFTEVPPSVTIQTGPTTAGVLPTPPSPVGPHQTVMLSPAGIQAMSPTSILLQVGTTMLAITTASITMQVGGSTIAITPAGVVITGPTVDVAGAATVGVTGGVVRINS